ncbi:aldo/keto reductase [Radiobacillus deserti]|uniref:Aldo/keto reductase family oxidoreductase n=1 Tax=Radiobacillus deserti TaxID=2594883 RepID=A0A516KDY1_9BACI|nr:aldo/keto reductase family oxidoreductase [Radiobacillus deserti]QDP39577.1 aldo/keto reductase family oxidoreductase [Radiobacillus deserti]
MERVQLAEDLSFSRVIHGLWRLNEWNHAPEDTLDLIEYCLELGITTFDHADIYGGFLNEELFGKGLALKPELRNKMELVTKCGIVFPSPRRPQYKSHHYNTSKKHIIESVEHSLKNLHTDFIDTLLIHRPDPFMDPAQVAEAFTELKQEGKVRYFGVSNFKQHQFNMLQSYLDFDLITNQIEVSAYELENFDDGTINLCQEKGIAPMAWSPLAGGRIFSSEDEKAKRLRAALTKVAEELHADGIDQVLYAWLLVHPANIMPIVGSGKKDRIKKATEAVHLNLSLDQWFEILHASMGHEVP